MEDLTRPFSARESDFPKMETYSNWCYIDRLEGKDLQDGEEVEIVFPDRTIERHRLKVRAKEEPYNDMGHTYTMPIRQAGIEINHHGLRVWGKLPEGTRMRRVQ